MFGAIRPFSTDARPRREVPGSRRRRTVLAETDRGHPPIARIVAERRRAPRIAVGVWIDESRCERLDR